MSEPYISSILLAGWDFASEGYASCNGEIMPITQNQALFSLLGNAFGGDGVSTFGLPDLRGRAPVNVVDIMNARGLKLGSDSVTLSEEEMPSHNHSFDVYNGQGDYPAPNDAIFAHAPQPVLYHDPNQSTTSLVPMDTGMIGETGGSQSHPNLQPYQVINFLIAVTGLYPSRN